MRMIGRWSFRKPVLRRPEGDLDPAEHHREVSEYRQQLRRVLDHVRPVHVPLRAVGIDDGDSWAPRSSCC
jgi:hypothetical protein